MASKGKFRKFALSSVCVFSLLSNTAQAFTAAEYFDAAARGNYAQLKSYIDESRAALQQQGAGYQMNLDIRDPQGNTALMKAAEGGHMDIVSYLASNGASLNLGNSAGGTAYSMAVANGYPEIANYIAAQYAQNAAQAAPVYNNPYGYQVTATAPQAATAASSSELGMTGPLLIGVGALAAAGAAIGLSAGGGGGNANSNGGGGVTATLIQTGITDSGGSSGAGTLHPASGTPSTFLTTESQAQEGYAGMRTQYAAARGYDGSLYVRNPSTGLLINNVADAFIKVAVLDTGVDLSHPDLDGNILTANAVNCRIGTGCTGGGDDDNNLNTAADNAEYGHGTFVAGIIAAEKGDGTTGMQGIAPQAKIMPIAFLNEYNDVGAYLGSDISGIQYATVHGANILNASYGVVDTNGDEVPIKTPTTAGVGGPAATTTEVRQLMDDVENGTTYRAVFQNMVAAHQVIVWAAGNASMSEVDLLSGLPYYFHGTDNVISGYSTVNPNAYDWSKNWITVVSLDDNLTTLSSFSNQCGIAKNWCLAAPGRIASSTQVGGGYTAKNGTSFAAPNVTGALAVLMGAFPHLTPERAVQILFDTATDLGTAGVDDVFGHGLVNLDAATDPSTGGWTLSTGLFASSYNAPFETSRLSLSAPFGDGLGSLSRHNIMFLDKYTKDYLVPVSSLVNTNVVKKDPLQTMQEFGGSNLPQQAGFGAVKFGFTATAGAENTINKDETRMDKMLVSADLPILNHVVKANFSSNASVADVEKFASKTSLAENTISGAFKNQYLGMSEQAKNIGLGFGDEKLGAKMGYYFSGEKDKMLADRNNASVRGFYSSVNYKPSDDKTLFMQSGVNVEDGAFLGAESSGAFALGNENKTYFTSLSYEQDLADNLTFLGAYSLGMTDLSATRNSLVKDVSNAMSDSFALGLEYKNVLENDGSDKFGFSFSQPLRIRSAKANISLPMDILADSSIVYDNFTTSIAPKGRELDFGGYYSAALSPDSGLLFGSMLRHEADNVKDAPLEALFMTKYNLAF